MTKVVNCKKAKYDIYIGRPSKWGNPFKIGKDGTRKQVIEKYQHWFLKQPRLLKNLSELEGKVLGCWCKPKSCHGDVLVKFLRKIRRTGLCPCGRKKTQRRSHRK